MHIIHKLAFLWYVPIFSGLLSPSLSCNQASEFPQASYLPGDQQTQITDMTGAANIVFKSMDGGQTWQDISEGLPKNLQENSTGGNSFFANDNGLFLKVANGRYHSTPNATAPFWTKALFPGEDSSVAAGKPGIFVNNYWGVNLKTTNGTSVWSPVFDNSSEPRLRSVFETAGGAIFIGTDRGLFKTADNGKTWKHVYAEGWAGNMAESNGVLVSTSSRRIIRSTDDGENWTLVSEGGLTWDVKQARGGFAAITSSVASNTRRLQTSDDGGKTWHPIGTALRDKVVVDSILRTWNDRPRMQAFQASIIQVGENFFCAHPGGIFRSPDKGKTWKLLLPSIDGKVFSLFVSSNVIYAIPSRGGC